MLGIQLFMRQPIIISSWQNWLHFMNNLKKVYTWQENVLSMGNNMRASGKWGTYYSLHITFNYSNQDAMCWEECSIAVDTETHCILRCSDLPWEVTIVAVERMEVKWYSRMIPYGFSILQGCIFEVYAFLAISFFGHWLGPQRAIHKGKVCWWIYPGHGIL